MPETRKTHILRYRWFSYTLLFVAAIGKLWGDGGLKDLLVDSSVDAAVNVDQMLAGKQFNRAVRGLTLVYEALMVVWLSAFFRWCKDNDLLNAFPGKILVTYVFNFVQNSNMARMLNRLLKKPTLRLVLFYYHFLKTLDSGMQYFSHIKYRDIFLRSAEIMIQNIRSEREGSWHLQLTSISAMLPYMLVTNRINYSRWLPFYIIDMLNLPSEVQTTFAAGQFSIRHKTRKFNGIWRYLATKKAS